MADKTRIDLTNQQRIMLKPFIERVQEAHSMGSPGILVCQISWDQDKAWMVPCFVPHTKAIFLEQQGNMNIPGRREPCTPGKHHFMNMTPQDRRRKLPAQKVCIACGEIQAI